jgi:para-nitrobenzyl esterase
MKMRWLLSLCAIVMVAGGFLVACAERPEPLTEIVSIASGTVEGVREGAEEDGGGGVLVFRGIPYAAPPVGELRWRAPQLPAPWDGVRQAKEFSPACWQPAAPPDSFYGSGPEVLHEDCLYLNVWTGARSADEKRPVMVWIHGGGLTTGTGAIYDSTTFAEKGMVAVTINYRLGPLGFLAHPALSAEADPASSGAYGLLDQIAALEWVRDNIAAFGGDPGNVTIFGESAGSWSVCYVTAIPLAAGLFHRAIGESGGIFEPMPTLAEVEELGEEFVAKLELEGEVSAADLREKTPEEIYAAFGEMDPVRFRLRPNVDGWVFPSDIHTIYAAGKQNDLPLIVGYNADEHSVFADFRPPPKTIEEYETAMKGLWGDSTEALMAAYPAASDEEAGTAFLESWADQLFAWQMRTWARMASATGSHPVRLYHFRRVPPGPRAEKYGAYHGAEIAYAFGGIEEEELRSSLEIEAEEADFQLAEVMSSYWTNFARTGDPNGEGLAEWPVYQPQEDNALVLDAEIRVEKLPDKDRLDAIDRHYASMRDGHE